MGLDPHEIGVRGFGAYMKMIFEDGFFHGDPHPGNLLVTKDGDIVFLDFGIVGILRPEKRQGFPDLCPDEHRSGWWYDGWWLGMGNGLWMGFRDHYRGKRPGVPAGRPLYYDA